MKSTRQDSICSILAEQDFKNLICKIKSLPKEDWILLINDNTAMQTLVDIFNLKNFEERKNFSYFFTGKLADRDLTSTEDFMKVVNSYHFCLFFHRLEEKFDFLNRLRQVLKGNILFAREFCTNFFDQAPTHDFFHGRYLEQYNLSQNQSQLWGDGPLFATGNIPDQQVFELALKVCVDNDNEFLLEILKKFTPNRPTIEIYQSMCLIKWALMFNHHRNIVNYLDYLKKNNMYHLTKLLSFHFWPDHETRYVNGINLPWRAGIPLQGIKTAQSIYMMALLHNANEVIKWIHCLHINDETLSFDYFTGDNISRDIMYAPEIAEQCFSSEMMMLKNKISRCIEAECSSSSSEESTQKRTEGETPLCFYIKKHLVKAWPSRELYHRYFIQRFVMAMLFDADGSFESFPDLCASFFYAGNNFYHRGSYGKEQMDSFITGQEAFVYDGKCDFCSLFIINRVFSDFFYKVKKPSLSLARYKTLLEVIYKSVSEVRGVLAQRTELKYLSPLSFLSETLIDTNLSHLEFLEAHKHAINKCTISSILSRQNAIVWIIKADSIIFTDKYGKLLDDNFYAKEKIYKHLLLLIKDEDLLADIKQSLFDMYMYRASLSPISNTYYAIAHRHLQDLGKHLDKGYKPALITSQANQIDYVGSFNQDTQKQKFTRSCSQFIEKISGLPIQTVEYRVIEAGYSFIELKNLLLNEDLYYTGFYERILEIKNQKYPQPDDTAVSEQSVSISKGSLFSQQTEHSAKRLKTNS